MPGAIAGADIKACMERSVRVNSRLATAHVSGDFKHQTVSMHVRGAVQFGVLNPQHFLLLSQPSSRGRGGRLPRWLQAARSDAGACVVRMSPPWSSPLTMHHSPFTTHHFCSTLFTPHPSHQLPTHSIYKRRRGTYAFPPAARN